MRPLLLKGLSAGDPKPESGNNGTRRGGGVGLDPEPFKAEVQFVLSPEVDMPLSPMKEGLVRAARFVRGKGRGDKSSRNKA